MRCERLGRVWIWVKRAIKRSPAETIRTELIRLARNNQRNFIYGSTAIKTFAFDYLLMQFKSSAVSRNEPRWGLVKKSSLPLIRDRAAWLRGREREIPYLRRAACAGCFCLLHPWEEKGRGGNKTTQRQMNMVCINDRKEKKLWSREKIKKVYVITKTMACGSLKMTCIRIYVCINRRWKRCLDKTWLWRQGAKGCIGFNSISCCISHYISFKH